MTVGQDLGELAKLVVRTLNVYESHTLEAYSDPGRGISITAHNDVRACSDRSLHDPWRNVVERWPCFDSRASAHAGRMSGAEVAVLSNRGQQLMVRYIATDHRWVLDEDSRRRLNVPASTA